MTTPHDIRCYIERIKETSSELSDETKMLMEYCDQLLPRQPKNGKTCPVCDRKMFTACSVCPHCNHRVKAKRRRLTREKLTLPSPPEAEPLAANKCRRCLEDLHTHDAKHTLDACGCTYHIRCLQLITKEEFRRDRRCTCENGRAIPQEFYT